ncbi:hypothetical protein KM043_010614 [Ampulex compressa]|nr:hypothetical protein KM043_010614 [Ampulex compressa]
MNLVSHGLRPERSAARRERCSRVVLRRAVRIVAATQFVAACPDQRERRNISRHCAQSKAGSPKDGGPMADLVRQGAHGNYFFWQDLFTRASISFSSLLLFGPISIPFEATKEIPDAIGSGIEAEPPSGPTSLATHETTNQTNIIAAEKTPISRIGGERSVREFCPKKTRERFAVFDI